MELLRTTGRLPVIPFDGHYDGVVYRVVASAIAGYLASHSELMRAGASGAGRKR